MLKPKKMGPFRVLTVSAPKGLRYIKETFLRQENIELDQAKLHSLEATFDEFGIEIKVNGKSVIDYDFVWIQTAQNTKDIAYMLSLYLDEHGIPHTKTDLEISKLVDMSNLAMAGISIPKTFFCDIKSLMGNILYIQKELGYPYVIKPTVGNGGLDIHLVRNVVDLINTLPKLAPHKKYVCQAFIQNDFDYRIIVGNGKVLSGEKRIRTTDLFRNNASLGAKEVFLDIDQIPSDVKELALSVCKICDFQWSGLDIVTDKITGKNYVLEMNRCPDLTKGSSEVEAAMTYLKSLKDKTIKKEISFVEIETQVKLKDLLI